MATAMLTSAICATPVAACPDFGHPNLKAGPSIDLGGGIVLQHQSRTARVTGREDLFAEAIYMVQDCAAGSALWLHTYREEPRGNPTYDHTDEVLTLLDDAKANSEQRSIGTLVASAAAPRIDTLESGPVGVETCMCAELYPELQGDKVPYEDVK